MVPQFSTSYSHDYQSCNQMPHGTLTKNTKQQHDQSNFFIDSFNVNYEHQKPKSFSQFKKKIEAQISQTIGCLNQQNKRILLNSLNNSYLLPKDSGIFLQNYSTLKDQKNEKPEQIEKYLNFETGAEYSSQQRKEMY